MNRSFIVRVVWIGIFICGSWFSYSAFCRDIEMVPHWDDKIALENPHKGWYHHYPDNHIDKYKIKQDSDLLDFPGMDHVYIRLAWAYLEPQEGKFDWEVIDSIIQKWAAHGIHFSFRISCKETSTDRVEQQYATPKWVMESGAKGDYYRNGEKVGPEGPWEPVFDDPVFLEKLDRFLQVFALRYDGNPGLRYVDIGSIGDWGEGHTHSGSRIPYGYEARKKHIDLHLKYFTQSQLVISDDFVYGIADPEDRQRLHRYIVERGISYRDDSILVDWYIQVNTDTYTVRSPEFFADTYLKTPTVFELEHYSTVRKRGNWLGAPDSTLAKFGQGKSGADLFRGALGLLHATYIGYHGDAREWLSENRELSDELLNRCGYWYFLHRVQVPDVIHAGEEMALEMDWENRGVAPAYHPYILFVRLEGPSVQNFELEAGNSKWMPSAGPEIFSERYGLNLPASLVPGDYSLKIKLYSREAKREVYLALDPALLDEEKFYSIGTVKIVE